MGKPSDNDIITVRIKNWDKVNGKKNEKHKKFLVCEDIFSDLGFYNLSASGKVMWLHLLTLCARRASAEVSLTPRSARAETSLRRHWDIAEILKMSDYGMLDIMTPCDHLLREKKRREYIDQPDENARIDRPKDDAKVKPQKPNFTPGIEALYEIYPRKRGKTPGIKKLASEIKTQDDLMLLETAIKNYAEEMRGTDREFILHFSTFAGQWRDWLDPRTRGGSKKHGNTITKDVLV